MDHIIPKYVTLIINMDHSIPRYVTLVIMMDHIIPKYVTLVIMMDHIIPKYVNNPGNAFFAEKKAPLNKLIESPQGKMMSEGRSTRLGVDMGGVFTGSKYSFLGKG